MELGEADGLRALRADVGRALVALSGQRAQYLAVVAGLEARLRAAEASNGALEARLHGAAKSAEAQAADAAVGGAGSAEGAAAHTLLGGAAERLATGDVRHRADDEASRSPADYEARRANNEAQRADAAELLVAQHLASADSAGEVVNEAAMEASARLQRELGAVRVQAEEATSLRSELAQRVAEVAELRGELALLNNDADALRSDLARLRAECAEGAAERVALAAQCGASNVARASAVAEAESLSTRLHAREASLAQLAGLFAHATDELARLRDVEAQFLLRTTQAARPEPSVAAAATQGAAVAALAAGGEDWVAGLLPTAAERRSGAIAQAGDGFLNTGARVQVGEETAPVPSATPATANSDAASEAAPSAMIVGAVAASTASAELGLIATVEAPLGMLQENAVAPVSLPAAVYVARASELANCTSSPPLASEPGQPLPQEAAPVPSAVLPSADASAFFALSPGPTPARAPPPRPDFGSSIVAALSRTALAADSLAVSTVSVASLAWAALETPTSLTTTAAMSTATSPAGSQPSASPRGGGAESGAELDVAR
jgi:hypothetical protein